MNFMKENEIVEVAETISKVVPNCCGVTLGGSRANNLDDSLSDVEMYFYSKDSIPTIEEINICLLSLGAKHKRCQEFLWDGYPWGPHSFFLVDGLYFEIGYRIVDDIDKKIQLYLEGNVAPKKDCHDLGLGYVYSGLAASLCSEKILIAHNDAIENLKAKASVFPDGLRQALLTEYMLTAKSLLNDKLVSAVNREDIFLYDVLASRIVRSLMIMAFSISRVHFPGDKWNEKLLLRTTWKKKIEFLNLLKKHCRINSADKEILIKKREILVQVYNMVEEGLHESEIN